MTRLMGSFAAALVAWWFAAALNVPVWNGWWPAGDRTDIAIWTFFAALWLTDRSADTA